MAPTVTMDQSRLCQDYEMVDGLLSDAGCSSMLCRPNVRTDAIEDLCTCLG